MAISRCQEDLEDETRTSAQFVGISTRQDSTWWVRRALGLAGQPAGSGQDRTVGLGWSQQAPAGVPVSVSRCEGGEVQPTLWQFARPVQAVISVSAAPPTCRSAVGVHCP